MAETFEAITAEQYMALPGQEGGGFMGCVFKYSAGTITGRRKMIDECNPKKGWEYARSSVLGY